MDRSIVEFRNEQQKAIEKGEGEKRLGRIFIDSYERWSSGIGGKRFNKLVELTVRNNNAYRTGDSLNSGEDRELVDLGISFQTDYALWVLSMPNRDQGTIREFSDRVCNMVGCAGKGSEHSKYARSYIEGAVGVVTFMDFVWGMGDEYKSVTVDELIPRDQDYDRTYATDLVISGHDKIFLVQIKTIDKPNLNDKKGMVQVVEDGGLVDYSGKEIDRGSLRAMLALKKKISEAESAVGGEREVIPIVVFVPSMESGLAGLWTGFLKRKEQWAKLTIMQVDFTKKMKELGFIIKNENNE